MATEKTEKTKYQGMVIILEDGELRKGTADDLEGKNEWYRISSERDGITLIDYDKTKIRPFVKDILNRQNTFLEIKLLRWIIIGLVFIYLLSSSTLMVLFLNFPSKSALATTKNEIVAQIAKLQTMQTAPVQTVTETVPVTETRPNLKRNIPSYGQ